jgi:ketosteroid isomerase-like protein
LLAVKASEAWARGSGDCAEIPEYLCSTKTPSGLLGRKRHSIRMNVKNSRHLYLVLPIVCVLFSDVPRCPAQQTLAAKSSLLTDMQTFQQVEDRWSKAINNRDQYALELVLSPELIDISATGDVTTRNQQISMLFHKGTEPLSLDQHVVSVQTFGNLAVVIGTYVEQLRVNEKPVLRKGMFTHIYQYERGNWFCINAHRTASVKPVAQKAQGAKK